MKQLIGEGRKLKRAEGDLQWKWGDLLGEVAPLAGDPAHTGATAKIREFVEAVFPELGEEEREAKVNTFRSYRDTSAAWPPARRRAGTSFSRHAELRGLEDRFELIDEVRTVSEARGVVARHRAGDVGIAENIPPPSAPEEGEERPQPVAAAERQGSTVTEPVDSEADLVGSAEKRLTHAAGDVREALEDLLKHGRVDGEDRQRFLASCDRVQESLDALRSFLTAA